MVEESPRELSFEVSSVLEQMQPAWDRIAGLALENGWQPGERLENLHLAFIEGLTNVIIHAHASDGRAAAIKAWATLTTVELHLCDSGPGIDWPTDPEVPDVMAESGRGIFLIHSLTDYSDYRRRGPGDNVLVMRIGVALLRPGSAL